MKSIKKYLVADLFSGAGGASYGFKAHPEFELVFAADRQNGKPCNGVGTLECNKTYATNIGVNPLEIDLGAIEPDHLLKEMDLKSGRLDVLISCAPCTGFSRALNQNHLEDDPRNHLVGRTGLFVEAIRPKFLIMENARELVTGNFSHHSRELCDHLERLGYSYSAEVHMLSKYGLPQSRERALIIARRDGKDVKSLADLWFGHRVREEAKTVRRAIADLPPVAAGERHPDDPMHVSPSLGKSSTLERLKAMPHDGGSWADLIDHPESNELLIPSMKRAIEAGKLGSHPDVYGRLWWDKPSVTIKRECGHTGNGRYAHPTQNRLCTVRELACLQGFPTNYQFVAKNLANMYRHIGDAVPPMISFQLAHLCCWMLSGSKPTIQELVLEGTNLRETDLVSTHEQQMLFV